MLIIGYFCFRTLFQAKAIHQMFTKMRPDETILNVSRLNYSILQKKQFRLMRRSKYMKDVLSLLEMDPRRLVRVSLKLKDRNLLSTSYSLLVCEPI